MEVWRALLAHLLLALSWVEGEAGDAARCSTSISTLPSPPPPPPTRCLEKGFNSAKLLCSSCADLRQFDLAAVAGDCEACCTDDGGASTLDNVKYGTITMTSKTTTISIATTITLIATTTARYERAILEVCG